MKLVLFGPTGNVGREVVELALAAGHEVRAYTRSPSPLLEGCHVTIGALSDEAAIRQAIRGADAVISTLGPRANTADQVGVFRDALERITRIMMEEDARRLVSISGAGLWLPGDPRNFGRTIVTGLMKVVAKHFLAAKQAEAEVITRTNLDWVLVRPGRIVAGASTGRVAGSLAAPPRNSVSAGDVADFMLRATTDDAWVRKAPMIG